MVQAYRFKTLASTNPADSAKLLLLLLLLLLLQLLLPPLLPNQTPTEKQTTTTTSTAQKEGAKADVYLAQPILESK